jgi:enoyl-CoA hydratase/carnithine racemase
MAIDFEVGADGVALIVMNRPERMNALDAEHYAALSRCWQTVRDDPKIRCAIVTGAGDKSFTAGADLKSLVNRDPVLADNWLTQKDQILNRGLEVWKPVIAAVNGYCMGGGLTLLFATDIRIAVEGATFGLSEVKRGLVPGNGGTQRVMRQFPYAIAMEILLTGDRFGTDLAERWGLVNAVVPRDKLMPTAYDYARRIAENAPLAVQASKELAIRSLDMDLATGLRWETATNAMLRGSKDVKEGTKAFAEKRKPNFRGE